VARKNLHKILVTISVSFNILILLVIFNNSSVSASEIQKSVLEFPIYMNGNEITLTEGFIINGRSYVQLKEFCDKTNLQVDWRNPDFHEISPPGGGFPEGINLTNPTFVYTKEVTDYDETDYKILGVEITGIFQRYYSTNPSLKYSFGDDGFIIKSNGVEEVIPLDYNPISGRMYIEKEEFKEKILPYLVEICEQG
jgi:hypothetical protein